MRVEGSRVVARVRRLIRPPRREFVFTHIHGISWADVREQPGFGDVWPEVEPILTGAEFLAAHNARFDSAVLRACCKSAGIAAPDLPFLCTVSLARRVWRIRPTTLPCVCQRLGIELEHHDALSDAAACARIVIAGRAASAARSDP